MKTRINEDIKMDLALVPQTLSASNVTGHYFSMAGFRSALMILIAGALAAAATTKLEILQAKDASGTDAKVFDSTAADNAEKTLTANTNVIEGTAALASVANTDVVTVNGISFTKAAATDVSAQEFADAAGLVSCINAHEDLAGKVLASDSSTIVTVKSVDGISDVTLGKTENAGTITLATTKYQVYVEIKASDIDGDNAFDHIAPKVTSTGTGIVAVTLLRGNGRFTPEQIGIGKNL